MLFVTLFFLHDGELVIASNKVNRLAQRSGLVPGLTGAMPEGGVTAASFPLRNIASVTGVCEGSRVAVGRRGGRREHSLV